MMKLGAACRAFLFLFLAVFLTGCFQFKRSSLDEEKDPHYMEGEKRMNSMDYEGAIKSFERALQTNPRNSAAHFQLGDLYETRRGDPGSALYHYQRHLASRPDSPMAEVVKQKIAGCKRELAKSVAFVVAPAQIQQELARLATTNDYLKQQVALLQEQLARKPQIVTSIVTVAQPAPAPAVAGNNDPPEPEREPIREAPPVREPLRSPRHAAQTSSRNTTPVTSGDWVPRTITPPSGRAPAASSRGRTTSYTIRKGDTIASISRKYNLSIAQIVAVNPGINPNKILVGQTIAIPAR